MAQTQLNIVSAVKSLFVRRNYKDTLFRRAFSEKKYLLELYNALNRTAYDNPDDLTITTLEDVIYLSMKNDLSFIISSTLNLYEHQASVNPNMPIRGLLYLARQYESYIETNHLNVYGHARVMLPLPQFIIFYNGDEDIPKEMTLKLSDSYVSSHPNATTMLECIAQVININFDTNDTILTNCKRLHDYSYFVNEVKQNLKYNNRNKAIELAIDKCIEEDILTDILAKQRSEVMAMVLRYDEKKHRQFMREEGFAEGVEVGRSQGINSAQLADIRTLMLTLNLSAEEAMDALQIDQDKKESFLSQINN